MPTVQLVGMGPLPSGLNLGKVVRVANKVQHHFCFVMGDPINNLGEPDADGGYRVANLAGLLEKRRQAARAEVAIGVVDSQVLIELFSGVDKESKNVVISTDAMADILARTKNSLAAYVLMEVAAQLLTIEYRQQTNMSAEPEDCAIPWHNEMKSCLFDYCNERSQIGKKLIAPTLCAACDAALESANIRKSVKEACLKIVKEAVRPRFVNILREVLGDPIGRFLFGGLFLVLVQEALSFFGLNPKWTIPVLVVILLIIILRKQRSRAGLL